MQASYAWHNVEYVYSYARKGAPKATSQRPLHEGHVVNIYDEVLCMRGTAISTE